MHLHNSLLPCNLYGKYALFFALRERCLVTKQLYDKFVHRSFTVYNRKIRYSETNYERFEINCFHNREIRPIDHNAFEFSRDSKPDLVKKFKKHSRRMENANNKIGFSPITYSNMLQLWP